MNEPTTIWINADGLLVIPDTESGLVFEVTGAMCLDMKDVDFYYDGGFWSLHRFTERLTKAQRRHFV